MLGTEVPWALLEYRPSYLGRILALTGVADRSPQPGGAQTADSGFSLLCIFMGMVLELVRDRLGTEEQGVLALEGEVTEELKLVCMLSGLMVKRLSRA